MKSKSLIILLILIIIALVISNSIFILKYKKEHKMYEDIVETKNSNSKLEYEKNIEYEKKLDELREELSKYDSNYKNIIDIEFEAELYEITDNKLIVKGIENKNPSEFYPNMIGEFNLVIDNQTEIIYKNDVVDKSYLKVGQELRVIFSSEVEEKYPSNLSDIKRIEILDN